MLAYATQFATFIMQNHGRVVLELPKESGIWKLEEWCEFASLFNITWVVFDGCALNLIGKSGLPIREPWCLYTNDVRILQFFSQYVCPGMHAHEEAMGKNAKMSAFYTRELANVLMECWYPQLWYKAIPALVTLNVPRKVWLQDPHGLEAVQKEAAELRANCTWDDSSVRLVSDLRSQAKRDQVPIKLAELLTIVGIKHYELSPDQWKWKGRICYRGDVVRDAYKNILVFTETATTPTSIIALNVVLWYACLAEHCALCADAIQAFLQSDSDPEEQTWVILPLELWLDE